MEEKGSPTPDQRETKQQKKKKPFIWEYKISSKQLKGETTAEERNLLRGLLNEGLVYYLSNKTPVFLEKLGILLPVINEELNSKLLGKNCIIRKEKNISITFEKCNELLSFHQQQHPEIVETFELSRFAFLRLPLSLQAKWTEKGCRRYMRGIIDTVRNEVVVDGFSSQLSPIGDLISFHNRQGDNVTDWYAGANIFILPKFSFPLESEIVSHFTQPKLDSSWELFEAGMGSPIATYALDLRTHLHELGFDTEGFEKEVRKEDQQIDVAVFSRKSQNSDESRLLFVTDGLRKLARSRKNKKSEIGSELITQVTFNNSSTPGDEEIVSHPLANKLLTLGWVLIHSSKRGALSEGAAMKIDSKLSDDSRSPLSAVITTSFEQAVLPQRTKIGRFRYINVLGITEDEHRFAEMRSPKNLLTLLKCKRYDQTTSPRRRSIFSSKALKARQTA